MGSFIRRMSCLRPTSGHSHSPEGPSEEVQAAKGAIQFPEGKDNQSLQQTGLWSPGGSWDPLRTLLPLSFAEDLGQGNPINSLHFLMMTTDLKT